MIYDELFPESCLTQLDTGEADGDCLLRAICALGDEVRALRLLKEEQLDRSGKSAKEMKEALNSVFQMGNQLMRPSATPPAPPIAYPAPDPTREVAKSERLQYPWCEECAVYHHPDHWQCTKNGGNGVNIVDQATILEKKPE